MLQVDCCAMKNEKRKEKKKWKLWRRRQKRKYLRKKSSCFKVKWWHNAQKKKKRKKQNEWKVLLSLTQMHHHNLAFSCALAWFLFIMLKSYSLCHLFASTNESITLFKFVMFVLHIYIFINICAKYAVYLCFTQNILFIWFSFCCCCFSATLIRHLHMWW